MAKKVDIEKLYREGLISEEAYQSILEQSMSNKERALMALTVEEQDELTRLLEKMSKAVSDQGLVANFYCHKSSNTK